MPALAASTAQTHTLAAAAGLASTNTWSERYSFKRLHLRQQTPGLKGTHSNGMIDLGLFLTALVNDYGYHVFSFVLSLFSISIAYVHREYSADAKSSEGLEPRAGPFWKVYVAYMLIQCDRLVRPKKKKLDNLGWLESRHFEKSDHDCFNDSFYWWASNHPKDRTRMCVTTRLGFHGIGGKRVTPWLVFDIDGETYGLPEDFVSAAMPSKDTNDIAAVDEKGHFLRYTCLEPMKQWRLEYNGMVVPLNSGDHCKSIPATMDLSIKVTQPAFYYQKDWDQLAVAKSMSSQPWSVKFFQNLRSEHQEHYEMGTTVSGTLNVAKQESYCLKASFVNSPGFRDHSFGKRDWTIMVRYLWLGTVSFVQPLVIGGCKYTHMSGTAVHYGTSFKHMVAGGLMGPATQERPIIPFTGMTHMKVIAKEWYEKSAEEGAKKSFGHLIPNYIELSISIKGSRMPLKLKVWRNAWKHGFFMQDNTFEVHEGTSVYTISHENGQEVEGHGLLEFGGVVDANAKKIK